MRSSMLVVAALALVLALGAGMVSLVPSPAGAVVPPGDYCWVCAEHDWGDPYGEGVICQMAGSGWGYCSQPSPYRCTIGNPGCNAGW